MLKVAKLPQVVQQQTPVASLQQVASASQQVGPDVPSGSPHEGFFSKPQVSQVKRVLGFNPVEVVLKNHF